jgi:hypothetical protein
VQQKSSQCDAEQCPLRQSPFFPHESPPLAVALVGKLNCGAQSMSGFVDPVVVFNWHESSPSAQSFELQHRCVQYPPPKNVMQMPLLQSPPLVQLSS